MSAGRVARAGCWIFKLMPETSGCRYQSVCHGTEVKPGVAVEKLDATPEWANSFWGRQSSCQMGSVWVRWRWSKRTVLCSPGYAGLC